jgi:negative regulator of sigma E activity
MNTTNWTERLSEYLDGTLTPAETAACEAWLSQSAEGRTLLEELRRVVAKAKTLPDAPVPASVWAGISAGIKAEPVARGNDIVPIASRQLAVRTRRSWNFSPMQLASAAAVLIAVGTGIGFKLRPRGIPLNPPGGGVTTAVSITPVGNSITPNADEKYDRAVADLQVTLEHNRANLDTATVRVLETSLARIDKAIADAQRALEADPNSAYLNDHLSRIKRKKLDLLRQGTSLARAS